MNKNIKRLSFLVASAFLMPVFLFSCSQGGSPLDNTDYLVTTKFIGCRLLGLKESYHKNDSINLSLEANDEFKLPTEVGLVEILDYDGNIVPCRYDRKDDKDADLSFKMPASNVTISCSAISTKKYKFDLNFGDDYKFLENVENEYLPGTPINLHLIPKSFDLGIACPSEVTLPSNFTYRCCADALGAEITGIMPNENVTFNFTGTSRPSITQHITSAVVMGYSAVAELKSVKKDPNYTGGDATVDLGVSESNLNKVSIDRIPSGKYSYKTKFKYVATFNVYGSGSDVACNLPNIQPEEWETKVEGFPIEADRIKYNCTWNGSNKTLTITGPVIGNTLTLDWWQTYNHKFYCDFIR